MSEHEALYHVNLTTHNIKMIPEKTSEIFQSKKSNQASKRPMAENNFSQIQIMREMESHFGKKKYSNISL